MYISFLFALVIFHHITPLQSLRQCNSSNDCYSDNGEITNVLSDVLWRCCKNPGGCHSFSSDDILRCRCFSDKYCHHDEKCDLGPARCVPARKCVNDSDCYRIGEGIVSWRCCQMDKRCYLKRDKEKTKWSECECSSSDDCLSNEICKYKHRYGPQKCYAVYSCKEDSDCGVGKECARDDWEEEWSCRLTSAAFYTLTIGLPFFFIFFVPVTWISVITIRRKKREQRARSRTAARVLQHNRPRAARGGRATTSQSTGTSTHNDNTVVEEQRRPRVRPPKNERSGVERVERAIQTTELQSASSSSHTDSAVTVELCPTPTAPPLIPEEAMDVTIPSDKEHTGIAVASAATPGFSGSFVEPPPPSYEEVMRNSSYLERLA